MAEGYVAPLYNAPAMLSAMHGLVSIPRNYHSQDIVDLFSSDSNARKDYAYGLVIYGSIMAGVFLLWTSILIVLKLKGDVVGCASGKPFQTTEPRIDPSLPSHSGNSGSTELEESGSSQGSSTCHEELVSLEDVSADQDEASDLPDDGLNMETVLRNVKRQRRSRIAFLLAAIVNVACTGMLLAYCFKPIEESSNRTKGLFDETQDIINELNTAIASISDASAYVNSTGSSVNLNYMEICPNFDPGINIEADLENLSSVMKQELDELHHTLEVNVTSAKVAIDGVQDGLDEIEMIIGDTNERLWALPALILSLCVISTAAAVSLILVWRGKGGPCLTTGISKCQVPVLILFSLVCWSAAVASAFATITSSDTCMAGSAGNPEGTVQDFLGQGNLDQNDYLYTMILAYSSGCRNSNPTEDFEELEADLQVSIATIWRQLSLIDSFGRAELAQECGRSLDNFLLAARNLARGLTLIRKSLHSAISTLQCERVNPIYVEGVQDILCTETANGIAWGYLLLSIVSVGMMTMVTLRSGLYEAAKEEKVYNESEVADHMILDEHEEYLAYISKYKHEWQEYDGINGRDIPASPNSSEGMAGAVPDESSLPASLESIDGEEEVSIVEKMSDLEESWPFANEYESGEDVERSDDETASSYDADSVATDDISFLSLRTPVNQGDGKRQNNAFAVPALLPGLEGEEEEEDDNDDGPLGVPSEVSMGSAVAGRRREADASRFAAPGDNSNICGEVLSPTHSHDDDVELCLTSKQDGQGIPNRTRHRDPPEPDESRDDVDTRARRQLSIDTGDEARDDPPASSRGVGWFTLPDVLPRALRHPYIQNSRRNNVYRPPTPPRRKTPKIRELITKFDPKDP